MLTQIIPQNPQTKQPLKLGFKHPQDVRRTIDAEAVNHILKSYLIGIP